jgi:hypothetical protein
MRSVINTSENKVFCLKFQIFRTLYRRFLIIRHVQRIMVAGYTDPPVVLEKFLQKQNTKLKLQVFALFIAWKSP